MHHPCHCNVCVASDTSHAGGSTGHEVCRCLEEEKEEKEENNDCQEKNKYTVVKTTKVALTTETEEALGEALVPTAVIVLIRKMIA